MDSPQHRRRVAIITVSILPLFGLITVYQCGWTEGVVVAAAGPITNVAVGERVLFPVSDEGMSHNYAIKLKFNSTTLFSWSSRLNVSDVRDSYKHRIGILQNGSIYMDDVQLNDSGVYLSETHDKLGFKSTKSSNCHLQVFEPVSKPTITAECLNGSISLSCFSSQGSEVTYSWETLPPCGDDSCVHLGATVEIHPSSESTAHTCTAQNPVSRATSGPIDLGVCSIQQPPGLGLIPGMLAVLLISFLAGTSLCLSEVGWNRAKDKLTNHGAEITHLSRLSTAPKSSPERSVIIYSSVVKGFDQQCRAAEQTYILYSYMRLDAM